MKKAYKKPLLIVERFALSQTIAAGCGKRPLDYGVPALSTQYVCGWDLTWGAGIVVIFETLDKCNKATEYYEFACYNAPEGGYQIFQS